MSELLSLAIGLGIALIGLGILLIIMAKVIPKRTKITSHPILNLSNDAMIFNAIEEVRSDCSGNPQSG